MAIRKIKRGKNLPKVSLVVPVYNEAEAAVPFVHEVNSVLAQERIALEIVFINDGSEDNTLTVLRNLQEQDERIIVIDLSRNFGKEAALAAGLHHANGDAVIPIDVDLQDPIEVISSMLREWEAGAEVVLAQRVDRSSDHPLKRWSAHWFYRIQTKLAESPIPPNVGDFRLMDRKVVNALRALPESQLYMKGLFAWLGFTTVSVPYARPARIHGETSFSTRKLIKLAISGLLSFSLLPLRIWTYIGSVVSLASIGYGLFIVLNKFFNWVYSPPGYSSIVALLLFLSGIQLMGIGVLGEYLGRTFIESKQRPAYIVRGIYRKD